MQEIITITDPPYELDTKGGGVLKESKAMKGIRDLGIDTFDPAILENKSKTSVFFCNKSLVKKYIELAEKWGVSFDINFYKKENTAPNYGGHLMTDVEYIMVLGKQSPNKGLPKETYSKAFTGQKDLDNKTAWSKPVALIEKYIKLFSKADDIVLDLFGGSGSTLIACEKTNRICYMSELDPKYCDVIIKRWEDYTGNKAQKL
ncbi:MAG: site-specific DNA-methyltransferase [Magnetococcus sp. WYHC-3]